MTDIRRQLDDLLDCQPYRQDLYDNIMQSFEAMTQKCEELEKLRGLAQMTNSQRGAALAFADDQLLEARKCIAELQQKCDLWRVAAEKEEQLRLSSQQKCEEQSKDISNLEDALEAIGIKLKALAPHGICACSYDKPGDLCAHHSPQLRELQQKCEAAEAERERWKNRVDIFVRKSNALEARVIKLTEALERIASFYGRNGELTTLSTIAKAALESKTEEAK